ncbi:ABC-three component system protein [Segatella paludivivens]|uniref:ABC-three component system protein n=1 Tax=Segatella paludivivens TaxID=185294 RepID=UPI00036364EE|nr:ABC-three component system protein [Segatella paludivivens]
MSTVENHNKVETQVNIQNNYGPVNNSIVGPSRISSYFEGLCNEIANNTTEEIIDDLREYHTVLDGTKGLEGKLQDGCFPQSMINVAQRQKEAYAKKATKFECYPSTQKINLLLFAKIKNEFNTYLFPMIQCNEPIDVIMQKLYETIVKPIMDKLDVAGCHDEYLNYTSDHIYGMIYYLTGMCHLNWKDYDNV